MTMPHDDFNFVAIPAGREVREARPQAPEAAAIAAAGADHLAAAVGELGHLRFAPQAGPDHQLGEGRGNVILRSAVGKLPQRRAVGLQEEQVLIHANGWSGTLVRLQEPVDGLDDRHDAADLAALPPAVVDEVLHAGMLQVAAAGHDQAAAQLHNVAVVEGGGQAQADPQPLQVRGDVPQLGDLRCLEGPCLGDPLVAQVLRRGLDQPRADQGAVNVHARRDAAHRPIVGQVPMLQGPAEERLHIRHLAGETAGGVLRDRVGVLPEVDRRQFIDVLRGADDRAQLVDGALVIPRGGPSQPLGLALLYPVIEVGIEHRRQFEELQPAGGAELGQLGQVGGVDLTLLVGECGLDLFDGARPPTGLEGFGEVAPGNHKNGLALVLTDVAVTVDGEVVQPLGEPGRDDADGIEPDCGFGLAGYGVGLWRCSGRGGHGRSGYRSHNRSTTSPAKIGQNWSSPGLTISRPNRVFEWAEPGSNRRHMDFQSIPDFAESPTNSANSPNSTTSPTTKFAPQRETRRITGRIGAFSPLRSRSGLPRLTGFFTAEQTTRRVA